MASTSSILPSRSAENPSQSAIFRLKCSECGRLCNNYWVYTDTDWPVLCVGLRTDFSHIFEMFDDANMRSGLYPFFHIALLHDFGNLYMSDRLFDSGREQELFSWWFVHGMYHYTG